MLEEKKIKLCFIGNPNVGKSTLINRLLNSNQLQTSKYPGTTKEIIEKKIIWNEKEFVFLDTAGVYRKKNFNFNLLVQATRFSEIIILILDSSIDKERDTITDEALGSLTEPVKISLAIAKALAEI